MDCQLAPDFRNLNLKEKVPSLEKKDSELSIELEKLHLDGIKFKDYGLDELNKTFNYHDDSFTHRATSFLSWSDPLYDLLFGVTETLVGLNYLG